jgi:Fibronectin type III domain
LGISSLAARTLAGTGLTADASASTFGLPSAPQSFTAGPGNGQAALSWTAASSDGGTPITGYQLRVSAGGMQSTLTIDPTSCTAGSCAYTLTGLTNGTRHDLRLTAANAAGITPAVNVSTTPHA